MMAAALQSAALSAAQDSHVRRTLLAVFAHPDDETMIGPLLARYAREGERVVLVIATDGRLGTRAFAGIPAGDTLARVRAEEARCAASRLGIEPPVLLGFEDGRGLAFTESSPSSALSNYERFAQELIRLFTMHAADAVVTWGPEGSYGHPDHRMVHTLVTDVFQRGGEHWPRELFFPGFARGRLSTAPPWRGAPLLPTEDRHLTVAIAVSAEDRQRARDALGCHRSQFTSEEMEELTRLRDHVMGETILLRLWLGANVPRTDLFVDPTTEARRERR
jgi:LmbE family N-acetylglucosaminyl deacetylase